jgi:tyrosine-protein kinase Etk/Wzc
MTQESSPISPSVVSAASSHTIEVAEPMRLLDVLLLMARHRRLVLAIPLSTALLTIVVALLMSNVYQATARILPPQQAQSTASLVLGQIAGLAGLGQGALAIKNPSDLYVGMLKSRTVADAIIRRFDLQRVYESKTMVDTRRDLAANSQIYSGKDGLISVDVEDTDPERAAAMANAYVEELQALTKSLAISEAAQRRVFFEQQLKDAKEQLAAAETSLQRTQESTGLISLDEQGRAIVESVARLRGQIAAKEVELTAMNTFATEVNPERVRVQEQIHGLKAQLTKLQKTRQSNDESFLSTSQVPAAGLEYVRRLRDVKYYEAMFEILAKQFEAAKIDEAKEATVVQLVDRAVPPDRKHKPKRGVIVLLSTLLSIALTVLALIVSERVARLRSGLHAS